MKNHKPQRGGKRTGSGRKPKYGEPTITRAYRIPKSAKPHVDQAVKDIIEPMEISCAENKVVDNQQRKQ